MNLMTLLKPKGDIEYLHKDDTLRQGLERMRITDFNITKTSGTVLPDYLSAPNYTVEAGWSVSFGIE